MPNKSQKRMSQPRKRARKSGPEKEQEKPSLRRLLEESDQQVHMVPFTTQQIRFQQQLLERATLGPVIAKRLGLECQEILESVLEQSLGEDVSE